MKRTVLIVLGIILVLAAVICVIVIVRQTYVPDTAVESEMIVMSDPYTLEPDEDTAEEEIEIPEDVETEDVDTTIAIDFDALRAINGDIYAWIEIDNTNISYPVLQSATDDTYYLTHNSDGVYSANGSIFSESHYNNNQFTNPVTVLYGHHMSSGAMFGNLESYFSDEEFFRENQIIKIYTEEGLLEYGVFAAVPYSNKHILFYYDFTDDDIFESFFDTIFATEDEEALFNMDYAPVPGDRVLVLSTCLARDNTRRFLVMGTLLE